MEAKMVVSGEYYFDVIPGALQHFLEIMPGNSSKKTRSGRAINPPTRLRNQEHSLPNHPGVEERDVRAAERGGRQQAAVTLNAGNVQLLFSVT